MGGLHAGCLSSLQKCDYYPEPPDAVCCCMCEPMCFVTLMVTAGADAEADAPGGEEEEEEEEFVVWVRSVSAEDGAYSLPAPRPHLRTSSGTIFDVYRGTVTDLCCFGAASMCSCFVLNTTSSQLPVRTAARSIEVQTSRPGSIRDARNTILTQTFRM